LNRGPNLTFGQPLPVGRLSPDERMRLSFGTEPGCVCGSCRFLRGGAFSSCTIWDRTAPPATYWPPTSPACRKFEIRPGAPPADVDEAVAYPRGATFSPCGTYRYTLTRRWADGPNVLTWVMLNPSTATAEKDDATIRRCIGFSRLWGYAGLLVVNLFAFRATKPADLIVHLRESGRTPGPDRVIEPENLSWIAAVARRPGPIVAAWGAWARRIPGIDVELRRIRAMARNSGEWVCLGVTATGEPRHPLMVPYSTARRRWPLITPGADPGAEERVCIG